MAASMKFGVFWDVVTLKLTNVLEAVYTSETLVNFNVTIWSYIPEYSKLQDRDRWRGLVVRQPTYSKNIFGKRNKYLKFSAVYYYFRLV
jgi:hypothetical protein